MNIIVAVDNNWGIGYEGTQTAVIPEDRRRFRRFTEGKTVVLGHRTMLDFPGGKPLKNRDNIVLSRDRDLEIPGALVVSGTDELREAIAGKETADVYVIGGESIYRLLLPYCERAIVTHIFSDEPADKFFPNLSELPGWRLSECGERLEHEGTKYMFAVYLNDNVREL